MRRLLFWQSPLVACLVGGADREDVRSLRKAERPRTGEDVLHDEEPPPPFDRHRGTLKRSISTQVINAICAFYLVRANLTCVAFPTKKYNGSISATDPHVEAPPLYFCFITGDHSKYQVGPNIVSKIGKYIPGRFLSAP